MSKVIVPVGLKSIRYIRFEPRLRNIYQTRLYLNLIKWVMCIIGKYEITVLVCFVNKYINMLTYLCIYILIIKK